MNIRSEGYITIQGWMRTELQLKGNELLVYSIIYGFSQTEDQKFTGSLQYLADWCGCTKQGVMKNLKSLIEKGLIEKEETVKNGIKFCTYSCIVFNIVERGIQHSLTNNIVKKIDNNKDNMDLTHSKPSFNFGKRPVDKKHENLYAKCAKAVTEFTTDKTIITLLMDYLKIRIRNEDKPLGISSWKGILRKLEREFDKDDWADVINQSINRNYASFFPVDKRTKSSKRRMESIEGIPHDGRYDDEDHTIANLEY